MDREELTNLIAEGPVRVTMNTGWTAHALYRAEDGKMKAAMLPLVAMSHVEPIERDGSGQ